ncbi:hypothetical protein M0805_000362 [Coniferiporia weirii]|nr:hypothetical protein M0805_000362 [Coniferiporia weirii]
MSDTPSSVLFRSRSAPSPLVDVPRSSAHVAKTSKRATPGVGRAEELKLKTKAGRGPRADTKTKAGSMRPGASQGMDIYVTTGPRLAGRKDPFNLADFFPARPGSPEPAVEWAWLGRSWEEDAEEESSPPRRAFSTTALDEYARRVVADAESGAFGMLGLGLPSFLRGDSLDEEAEEELEDVPAGMTIDEPFDTETLHERMCSRRQASERAQARWEGVRRTVGM